MQPAGADQSGSKPGLTAVARSAPPGIGVALYINP